MIIWKKNKRISLLMIIIKRVTPLDLVQVAHVSGTRSVPTQLLRCKAGANAIREAISKGITFYSLIIINILFSSFSLCLSIVIGEITALKQLLADYSDADVVNYQDREGKTPLHWACEKEYASCVKAVLVFYPNLNLKDKEGNTAMAIARKNANEEVKQELQRYGTPSLPYFSLFLSLILSFTCFIYIYIYFRLYFRFIFALFTYLFPVSFIYFLILAHRKCHKIIERSHRRKRERIEENNRERRRGYWVHKGRQKHSGPLMCWLRLHQLPQTLTYQSIPLSPSHLSTSSRYLLLLIIF